jgi:hypothetical protein
MVDKSIIMKKCKLLYKLFIAIFMVVLFTTNCNVYAQNTISSEFDVRGPLPTNPTPSFKNGIFNVRGDFHMIGNTNMVQELYVDNGTNNSTQMRFVDVDDDPSTYNSSSAYLNIPNDNCTKIVYAGLYWSGRAQDANSSGTLIANQSFTNHSTSNVSSTRTISSTAYNAAATITNITGGTSSTNRTFNIILGGGKYVTIRFNGNNAPSYSIDNSATFTTLQGTFNNNNTVFTISTTNNPLDFTINGKNYKINSVTRSGTNSVASNANYINVTAPEPVSQNVNNYAFNKRTIKFKKEGGSYVDLTADATQINFPTTSTNSDYIYVAYKDVTNLVTSGGNYFGANIALRQGSTTIGFGGGWGMVVIYENPTMKWRDIVVFDGFSNVPYNNNAPRRLSVDGFKAAQSGAINVDLGFMAYEGEPGRTQDYFKMKRGGTNNVGANLNQVNNHTNFPYLTLAGGRINTNYFNSEITNTYPEYINYNSNIVSNRMPYYKNNYGVDIAKISLANSGYQFIANSQTSTDFYFGNNGTSGDAFVLYNIVFGVDAYVPETEVFAKITPAPGIDINNLQPDDEVTLTAEIYNYGTDAIKDAKLQITVPPGMQLVSASSVPQTQTGSGATAPFSFNQPTWVNPVPSGSNTLPASSLGGVLEWVLNNVPTQNLVNGNKIPMAVLTYKLKVTNNCMVLQASVNNCILLPEIEGQIEGTGVLSGTDFTQKLVTGYNTDCNNSPKYDNLKMEVKPSTTFLDNCSATNPIFNEIRMFKRFCTAAGGVIPRAEVIGVVPYNYPMGTVFYNEAGAIISGDFPVDPNGNIIMYRAVLPGSPISCYLKLATQLDVIKTVPTVTNVVLCEGTPIVLNNTPSNTAYQLFYFLNQVDNTTINHSALPNNVGTHTIWVAEGSTNGGSSCYGDKVAFTITVNALPTAATVSDVQLCTYANYTSTITSGGNTIVWEYLDGSNWVTLGAQLSGVSVVANQLKVTKAPSALNGTTFRVKSTNGTNCTSYSESMNLTVKGCKMLVNPMIHTPLNR